MAIGFWLLAYGHSSDFWPKAISQKPIARNEGRSLNGGFLYYHTKRDIRANVSLGMILLGVFLRSAEGQAEAVVVRVNGHDHEFEFIVDAGEFVDIADRLAGEF